MRNQSRYDGMKHLWENEESLKKYLIKLKEVMYERRSNLQTNHPVELLIRNSVHEVEKLGTHEALTNAVIKLEEARNYVGDYIDSHPETSTTTLAALSTHGSQKEDEWIRVEDGLPEVIDKKMKPVLGYNGKGVFKCYYFPDHFKSVEWEDWDDYSEEGFPYTEADEKTETIWLRAGWYQEQDCDRCDCSTWVHRTTITHWRRLPPPPITEVK